MARTLAVDLVGSGGSESLFHFSGALLVLCMVFASISVISMVVFACGEDSEKKSRRHHNKHTPRVVVSGGGCGSAGGGGGGGGGV
ncbi:hypothetical protein FRX31_016307 [Thalictrum thalictroides]|uniref:Transmembrane protein n=1 Tax=Thalictrum thalictroides TaxID=46969 RepID=A0A7J6W9L8_THATH|nr:hypothetical protein FRX31_016307 [Thalictrum thalictroides]